MEGLLNNRTSALCFNKDDFMSKDFTVDKFVSSCRKYVSLETMLEDLGLYHKILCSAMVELINKDYADFVNLSSNLVGLDKSIKNLSFPLQKLQTAVEDQKSNLDENLKDVKIKFLGYSSVNKQKVLANYFLCLFEGFKNIEALNFSLSLLTDKMLPTENLERIALDLNLLQFHMSKICFKNSDKKGVFLEVTESLKEHLEYLFLQSLSENDVLSLCRILRIYAINNNERGVETYFRKTIVKPYMQKHLTEENILKYGLTKVYDKILSFVPTFCSAILNATRGSKRYGEVVTGYNFLVNAVFPEIVHCFDLIAPVHVYAPGDPQLFHHNFSLTISFLDQFEHYCEVQSSVQKLRKHTSYISFLSRWNLDLYFQILFQEIAGKYENSLLATTFMHKTVGNADKYLLDVSRSLIHSIKNCWDDKIFIQHLSSRFFQLTLQLISRFVKWSYMYLALESSKDQEALSAIHVATVIKDVELLICDLKNIFDSEISSKVSRRLVESSFQESVKILGNIIPLASSLLIKLLLTQCVSHLKLITDIPRLYRKTNRTDPSKASGYVSLVFDVLTNFLSATEPFLSSELKQLCLKQVTDGIITECCNMIRDVLTSIKKMEDSLKILKRARDKPLGQTHSGSISDDDKIRHQLAIDIENIEEKVKKLGLQVENLKSFKELKQLINLTEKHVA